MERKTLTGIILVGMVLFLCSCMPTEAEKREIKEQKILQYTIAVTDAVYKNQPDSYTEMTGSTSMEVNEIRNAWLDFVKNRLLYELRLDETEFTDNQRQNVDAVTQKLAKSVQYNIEGVNYDREKGQYYVRISVAALDIEKVTKSLCTECREECSKMLATADPMTVTSVDYEQVNSAYTDMIITKFASWIDRIGQNEQTMIELRITDADGTISISAEEWMRFENSLLAILE